MKVGRIKDPLYKDDYLGISHLPPPHLLRPPNLGSGAPYRALNEGSIWASIFNHYTPKPLNHKEPRPEVKF